MEKTVILWGQDDVLTKAVDNLLGTTNDWKVIRISDDHDEVTLAQAMDQVTPDVLIVHEGVFDTNARLLIRFVQDFPRLKIITFRLENNELEIFDKKTICIEKASDLLAVIKDDADSNV